MNKLDKNDIDDVMSLTHLQKGMLYHYLKEPQSNYYFEQFSLNLSGEVDKDTFRRAWDIVIYSNEMLRVVFRWEKIQNPVQVVLKKHSPEINFFDLSSGSNLSKHTTIEGIEMKQREVPFDLREVPFKLALCKMGNHRYRLIICNHHILYDGWSNGIILKEFFQAYRDLFIGRKPIIPVKARFKDFVKQVQSQDIADQKAYWSSYLGDLDDRTGLPVKQRGRKEAGTTRVCRTGMGEDISDNPEDFTKKRKLTTASLLYSAWGILLQIYNNSDDALFGSTVSVRAADLEGIDDIVGLFINTVPLRIRTDGKETTGDLLLRIDHTLKTRRQYETTALTDIKQYCGIQSNSEIFDSVVVIENYPLDRNLIPDNSPLAVESYSMVEKTHYDLTIQIDLFNGIDIQFHYNDAMLEESTVTRLARHYVRVIREMINEPEKLTEHIDLLPEDERHHILIEFNRFGTQYPHEKTVCQLFEEQVEKTPDRIACFEKDNRLTYNELDTKAGRLAEMCTDSKSRLIGLMLDEGIHLVTGMLGILKSGCAFVPISRKFPIERIRFIIEDCNLRLLITDSTTYENISGFVGGNGCLDKVLCIDQTDTKGIRVNMNRAGVSMDQASYVIYTSGSTGVPKGVLITHRNLFPLLMWSRECFKLGQHTRVMQNLSVIFDFGVFELLTTILFGGSLYFRQQQNVSGLSEYIEFINIHWINTFHTTPSIFSHILQSSPTETIPSLRILHFGGESLSKQLVAEASGRLSGQCTIYNGYGPTETTINSTIFSLKAHDKRTIAPLASSVPIGKPSANNIFYILNRHYRIQPMGVPGEIFIGGRGLAPGYLNRPELTAEKFIDYSHQQGSTHTGPGKIYRTGDLGRWLPEGDIEFLGRIDHQVKIRGHRIEPGEIETQLLKHEGVKEAVIIVAQRENGNQSLCAYIVSRQKSNPLNTSELSEHLERRLPHYMVPAIFVLMDELPLTPSGKLNRAALPEPGADTPETYTPPRSKMEKDLVSLWSQILNIEAAGIGIDDNFFHIGGHSLNAMALASSIHKTYNREVPLRELFKTSTIRGLAQFLENGEEKDFSAIPRLEEEREYYLLSPAQARMFVLQNMAETVTAYNIHGFIELAGTPDRDKFQDVFTRLIDRHESLRTSFHVKDGTPVQKIHAVENYNFRIKNYPQTLTDDSRITKTIRDFVRPFDLSQAPLLRAGLAKIGEEKNLLLIDMHHIISDGTSLAVLIKEFMALYRGESLPDTRVRYRDFAAWFNHRRKEGILKDAESYWLKQFVDGVPQLELPTDFARPAMQSFAGSHIFFSLPPEKTDALRKFAHDANTTIFGVLFSLFTILLAKISGQEDIVVGTPVAGRTHDDLSQLVGMFVNTLALRNFPEGPKTVTDFVREVWGRAVESFQYQEYPFEDLVKQVTGSRDSSRNPLFNTAFVLQNTEEPELKLPALTLTHRTYDAPTSKFDLNLDVTEEKKNLLFRFQYSTELFKPGTIKRFAGYFRMIVSSVLENKDRNISSIVILSESEKKRLLIEFNDTRAVYPRDKTLHQLFEEQVDRTGDSCALLDGSEQVTYGELNRMADRLAYKLQSEGVATGTIVAVEAQRSVETITAIIGILKSGCAYLPIDPDYPQERISYMLDDSNAGFMLTPDFLSTLSERNDPPAPLCRDEHCIPPNNLSYIIYTSGSTGRPKGVMVEHASIVNLILSQAESFTITRSDRILQFSTLCFDASVAQVFLALLCGAVLVLVDKDTLLGGAEFGKFVSRNALTHIHATPSFLSSMTFPPDSILSVKRILSGGDVCPVPLARKWSRECDFYNRYGPTETTVTAIQTQIMAVADNTPRLPIGKPLANITAYILDRWLQLLPQGTTGELYIGGYGVARGYLNRPELTSETFIDFYSLNRVCKIYKTGDLCKWLHNGFIEFLGRIDHQVKVRGFRIEPGEIEACLLEHDQIKETAVTCEETISGEKYLSACFTALKELDNTALKSYLAQRLPDYMIPSYFMQLEKMPLNQSGKIDRKSLPKPEFNSGSIYVPPISKEEVMLADIWNEILGRDNVGIDDNFFHLGGHSLKAIAMAAKVHKEFNVRLPMAEIFRRPTIRGLSRYLKESGRERWTMIHPLEKQDYYELSSAQKRLYVLQRLDASATAYNIPFAWEIRGTVDPVKLELTFNRLIRRHESLRTGIHQVDGQPVQRIRDNLELTIEHFDPKTFIRPFDPEQPPLLRVGLVNTQPSMSILAVDIHHIIADGLSLVLLIREFCDVYSDTPLSPLSIQYKEYARWQDQLKSGPAMSRRQEYWLRQFDGEIPVLELPTDAERPPVQSFAGGILDFSLTPGETRLLEELAEEENTTLFMTLLAIYTIFLYKISGQEDIVVGTPVAGRGHEDLKTIMGMFVNTLAMRNYPASRKTLKEFIGEVKTRALEAFENQDYQFEDLVERAAVVRDTSRNPIFDTMFTLNDMETSKIEAPGLNLTPYDSFNREVGKQVAKFDLTLDIIVRECLYCTFEYSETLFKQATIRRFIHYFKKVVSFVLNPENRDKEIARIEIISGDEKHRLLFDFNNTRVEYPVGKTLVGLIEEQAQRTPDRVAVVSGVNQLSYHQLILQANRLAVELRNRGIQSGAIAGIMTERSPYMILGVTAILKAGGAYLPIDSSYPEKRIAYMLRDSGVELLLTAENPAMHPDFNGKILEMTTGYRSHPDAAEPAQTVSPEDPAYLIYTSGSTGNPKAVMVRHDQWANASYAWRTEYRLDEIEINLLQVAGFSFDVFAGDFARTLPNGGKIVICPGEARLDPASLYRLVSRHRITLFEATPALVIPLMEYVYEQRLDTDHLGLLILGSDSFPVQDFKKLLLRFKNKRIINSYGVTEATIDTSYYEEIAENLPSHGNVPIGKPLPNMKFYVLDAGGTILPTGVPGELYIGGKSVAQGYLNRVELTHERFIHHPALPGERVYKTGDRAGWMEDGNMNFLGRVDQQVKIRGFRIEPGEIESRLLAHKDVKQAVVRVWKDRTGDPHLCAYLVPHPTRWNNTAAGTTALRTHLEQTMPAYMVPEYILALEKIPLTHNGKIDRNALPEPWAVNRKAHEAPRNETELKLVEIWAEVLGLDKESIGIDAGFFELGGHSLKATILVSKIHKVFAVNIPLAEIFKTPTIKQLSRYVKIAAKQSYRPVLPVEEKEYYVLSSAQKRLFILQQVKKQGVAYNMPSVYRLKGSPDIASIENSFNSVIARHESLRTSFHIIRGEILQQIHPVSGYTFAIDNHGRIPDNESRITALVGEFIRPFDLTAAPLLRVGLAKTGPRSHILMVDMNHIIADGMSHELLIRDFMQAYTSGVLPSLPVQYKDFALWQEQEKDSGALAHQERYWLDRFKKEPPVLELPTDYPRPSVQQFAGNQLHFEIDQDQTRRLNRFALDEGCTLFMVLLSIFTELLSRLGNRDDIVVGTPAAGRRHADLESVIGMFVNTLPLRSFPGGGKPLKAFLSETRQQTLSAFENQDYQFEKLVAQLGLTRDTGRNPLFDVTFLLQNQEDTEIEIPGLTLEILDHSNKTSKFDLSLVGEEREGKLMFTLKYCSKLFKPETIAIISGYFKLMIRHVCQNPLVKLSEIELIEDSGKERIISWLNQSLEDDARPFMAGMEVFQDRLARSFGIFKDKTAVEYGDQSLTYSELDAGSGLVSHLLPEAGAGPGTFIGLLIADRMDLIVTMLGIIKAGCVFIPLDPSYPVSRLELMMTTADIEIVIADGVNRESLSQTAPVRENRVTLMPLLHTDPEAARPPRGVSNMPGRRYLPEDMIYIYFTSGSTGIPKAITGKNRSLLHFINWEIHRFGIDGTFRVSQLTNIGFDAFLRDLFVPFCSGGVVCIPGGPDVMLNSGELINWIDRSCIHLVHTVPTFFRWAFNSEILRADHFSTLKYILLSGEKVYPGDFERWHQIFADRIQIVNFYGPTETTMIKTFHPIREDDLKSRVIPAGRPMKGSRIVILDEKQNVCGRLMVGELHIRTPYRSLGYYNEPQLNQLKFIPNPFGRRPGDILYRTGDLARILPDGNVEIMGRMDNQVKVRGHRVEPAEIEKGLARHTQISNAVVIPKQSPEGDTVLAVYYTSQEPITGDQVRTFLAGCLPQYMLPSYFIQLEQMPLNAGGKADRKSLAALELTPKPCGKGFALPKNKVEETLVRVWAEVLVRDRVGTNENFFTIGGDSVKTIRIAARMHSEGYRLEMKDLFAHPTIEQLAPHVIALEPADRQDPDELPRHEADISRMRDYIKTNIGENVDLQYAYPLTPMQSGIFFHSLTGGSSSSYFGQSDFSIKGEIDKAAIKQSFCRLTRRYDILRTIFLHETSDEPMQIVLTEHIPEFTYTDISHLNPERIKQYMDEFKQSDRRRGFDLTREPAMRAHLFKTARDANRLVWDLHHIAVDGWSREILYQDFVHIYRAVIGGKEPELTPVTPYYNYIKWLEKQDKTSSWEFWKEYLHDCPKRSTLPKTGHFSGSDEYIRAEYDFLIDESLTGEISRMAEENRVTVNSIFQTVWGILLQKYNNSGDVIFGTVVSGRPPDIDGIETMVGLFINTVPVRINRRSGDTIRQLLKQVREQGILSGSHEYLPLAEILSCSPLKQRLLETILVYQNYPVREIFGTRLREVVPGFIIEGIESYQQTDVNFNIIIDPGTCIRGKITFNLSIYSKEFIRKIAGNVTDIMARVTRDTDADISSIQLISEDKRTELLSQLNSNLEDEFHCF